MVVAAAGMCLHFLGAFAQAQSEEKYKVRLFPAPPLGIQGGVNAVAGSGSVAAVLTGKKLTLTGSFEKLASPATGANLRIGQLTAVRGDSLHDLTITKTGAGNSGTIAGTFDLTADQIDALKKGRLYIQIQSEGVPNGHLIGWLLK